MYTKYDYNPETTKKTVEGESHNIPSSSPYDIYLLHIPREGTVVIDGFTEVDGDPSSGEFRVHDKELLGRIEFNSDDEGSSISVDYDACGTVVWAEEYNDGREGINTIQNEIETLEGNFDTHNNDYHTDDFQLLSEKGEADGYASLDSGGDVPASQLGNVDGMEEHGNEYHSPNYASQSDLDNHIDSDGTSHTYINQDLRTSANVEFNSIDIVDGKLEIQSPGSDTNRDIVRFGGWDADHYLDLKYQEGAPYYFQPSETGRPLSFKDVDDNDVLYVDWDNSRLGVATGSPASGYSMDVSGDIRVRDVLNIDGGQIDINGTRRDDNWTTAFDRSVTGVSGSGNGTLTINRENDGDVDTDLSHNHDGTYLNEGSNLSDLNNVSTARDNLGLSSVANSGSHDDLSDVGSSDHHSRYSDSEAQDACDGNITAVYA